MYAMPHLVKETWACDVFWDKNERPVLYVVGEGRVTHTKDVLEVIGCAVEMTNTGPFENVCAVYNMLKVESIPFIGRFINSGKAPSTSRTAHIVIGTTLPTIKIVGSLMAVASNERLRTIDIHDNETAMEAAISRWLALPDRAKSYNIDNV
jgi:hypothetical protein